MTGMSLHVVLFIIITDIVSGLAEERRLNTDGNVLICCMHGETDPESGWNKMAVEGFWC